MEDTRVIHTPIKASAAGNEVQEAKAQESRWQKFKDIDSKFDKEWTYEMSFEISSQSNIHESWK